MPAGVNQHAIGRGHALTYFTTEFKTLIEDHLTLLINDVGTVKEPIPVELATKYHRNFYSLLADRAFHIDYKYHWAILRINGFHNPSEFIRTQQQFLKPDLAKLDALMRVHRTVESELF